MTGIRPIDLLGLVDITKFVSVNSEYVRSSALNAWGCTNVWADVTTEAKRDGDSSVGPFRTRGS